MKATLESRQAKLSNLTQGRGAVITIDSTESLTRLLDEAKDQLFTGGTMGLVEGDQISVPKWMGDMTLEEAKETWFGKCFTERQVKENRPTIVCFGKKKRGSGSVDEPLFLGYFFKVKKQVVIENGEEVSEALIPTSIKWEGKDSYEQYEDNLTTCEELWKKVCGKTFIVHTKPVPRIKEYNFRSGETVIHTAKIFSFEEVK